MVTSFPPARITRADRIPMSLPMTSKTGSTGPTSSRTSFSRVDELLCAEVEHHLTVGSASGADHVGAELTCELRHHRTDRAGSAVNEDALARLNAAVLDESLPRGLLPGNHRRAQTAEAIGPGRGPRQLARGESRRMNLNDDVVYRSLRRGPLHELHPSRSRGLVLDNDRFHCPPLCVECVVIFRIPSMTTKNTTRNSMLQ